MFRLICYPDKTMATDTHNMANRAVGYAPENHDLLFAHEATHWWFVARNRLIVWLAKRFAPPSGRYLEIGCGNGFVTQALSDAFPDYEVHATEFFESGLRNARKRLPNAHLFQLDASNLNGQERYEMIGAFDVIEHIEDDEAVLAGLSRALRPGGILLLNVPQHRWLWSVHDDYAQHQRRYSRAELHRKLKEAGLEITYSTSFVTLLLPLMWLHRVLIKPPRLEDYDVEEQIQTSRFMNGALGLITRFEHGLRRLGLPLPVGGSRTVVARKPA